MLSSWQPTTIGQQATLQRGFDITKAEQCAGHVPVVSSSGTNSYHNEAKVKAPGVVLGRKGVVGSVFYLKEDFWPHDTSLWVKDFHGNCPKFVYYFFLGRAKEIASMDVGSANPTLNRNHVHPIKIVWPELQEQLRIAAVLSDLDDKIELNTHLNQTLESMAQALFKSWFVDFDPVIDNAIAAGNPIPEPFQARAERRRQRLHEATTEGQTPLQPLPDELRRLFPDAFQETEELGWVPQGWKVEPVGSHLDVLETGRRPKGGVAAYEFGVPSVGAESIKGVANFDFEKTKFVPIEFFRSMRSGRVDDYDVLLYKDGGKPGEFKPRIGMYGEGFPFEEFAINEHVFRIRSNSLGQPFTYYQFSSERVFYELAVRGGKAAIPGINQAEVRSITFLIPDKDCLAKFNEQVQGYFKKMLKSSGESLVLSKIRDQLLPKLLSGQLRIPDVEAQLAEAGV